MNFKWPWKIIQIWLIIIVLWAFHQSLVSPISNIKPDIKPDITNITCFFYGLEDADACETISHLPTKKPTKGGTAVHWCSTKEGVKCFAPHATSGWKKSHELKHCRLLQVHICSFKMKHILLEFFWNPELLCLERFLFFTLRWQVHNS